MNLLYIDVSSYLPILIDACTKVFGESYREKITERLHHNFFYFHNNPRGIDHYQHKLYLEKSLKSNRQKLLYEKKLAPLREYALEEYQLKQKLMEEAKKDFIDKIYPILPKKIQKNINLLFKFDSPLYKTNIEFFSTEDEAIIQDKDSGFGRDKVDIIDRRLSFLEELGVDIYYKDKFSILKEYKELVPSAKVSDSITGIRKKVRADFYHKYISATKSFQRYQSLGITPEEVFPLIEEGKNKVLPVFKDQSTTYQSFSFFLLPDNERYLSINYLFLSLLIDIVTFHYPTMGFAKIEEDFSLGEYKELNKVLNDYYTLQVYAVLQEKKELPFEDISIKKYILEELKVKKSVKKFLSPILKVYEEDFKKVLMDGDLSSFEQKLGICNVQEMSHLITLAYNSSAPDYAIRKKFVRLYKELNIS